MADRLESSPTAWNQTAIVAFFYGRSKYGIHRLVALFLLAPPPKGPGASPTTIVAKSWTSRLWTRLNAFRQTRSCGVPQPS